MRHNTDQSKENYQKLRNCLLKMNKLNQIVPKKGHLTSIAGSLCLTKRHLDNPEGQVEVESP